MTRYEIELDTPIEELDELGWAKSRLFRDVNPERIDKSAGVVFEPITGTLMLRPKCLDEEWTYDATAAGSDKIPLVAMSYTTGLWEEIPYADALESSPSDKWMQSKHGLSLIEVLALVGEQAIELESGRELIPILSTLDDWPANAGLHVSYLCYGRHGIYQKDYLGIAFGQFFLDIHSSGTADLWYSTDGTRGEGTWELRKTFALRAAKQKDGADAKPGLGAGPQQVLRVAIIPMGRGHIYIHVAGTYGTAFKGIYTHPEAEEVDNAWQITSEKPVTIYTNKIDQKQVRVQLGKVSFPDSAVWQDVLWELPYAPTSSPTIGAWWSRTHDDASASIVLVDEDGDEFVSDGELRKCRAELELTSAGGGLYSPFVDGYGLRFPRTLKTQERTAVIVEADEIISLEFEDGESLDDQRFTAVVQNIDGRLDWLEERSEITGRLLIDGEPFMVFHAAEPEVEMRRTRNLITLTGVNYGAHRITEKRFRFAPTYGNITHPEAVTEVLYMSGFPAVDADEDTVTLPETKNQGSDSDTGETELHSQPQFGQSVREFLGWITDEFSGWRLSYGPDQRWFYGPRPEPDDVTGTFYRESSERNPLNRLPYYEALRKRIIPPEANLVTVFGKDAQGEVIATAKFDEDSYGTPGVTNYVGRWKSVDIIDPAINTDALLIQVRDTLYERLRRRIVLLEWDGPFVPSVRRWQRWTLEGVGDVLVTGIAAAANSPKVLEHTASTHYTGELIE